VARHAGPVVVTPGVPQVACFATRFHRGQPPVAELVPLPLEIRRLGVQRYGLHGLSYEFIASVLRELAPEIARGRVIVAHLGNGASVCALDSGRSVDSSLGFTAVDGPCMGTRPGALDPGVVLCLVQRMGGTSCVPGDQGPRSPDLSTSPGMSGPARRGRLRGQGRWSGVPSRIHDESPPRTGCWARISSGFQAIAVSESGGTAVATASGQATTVRRTQ